MSDLLKLLTGDKGTLSTRSILLLLVVWTAWRVTVISERLAVIENRLAVTAVVSHTNTLARTP